jgi:hypothetical protein
MKGFGNGYRLIFPPSQIYNFNSLGIPQESFYRQIMIYYVHLIYNRSTDLHDYFFFLILL